MDVSGPRAVTGVECALAPDTVIIARTDAQGTIVDVNDACSEASGYTREELVGATHRLLRHPDVPAEVFADLWRTLRRGLPWQGVFKNLHRSGDHYWVSASLTPTADGGYMAVRVPATRPQIARAEALFARLRAAPGLRLQRGRVPPRGIKGAFSWLNNLTVRARMWAGTLASMTLMLALAGVGFALLREVARLSALVPAAAGPPPWFAALNAALLIAVAFTLVAWPLAARWLIGGVTRGLAAANRAARRMSRFDLSVPVPWARDNEIGELLTSMAVLRNNLQESVAVLKSNVAALGAAGAGLGAASDAGTSSAQVQADATAGIAAAVEQLSVSIDHVGEHACDADEMSRAAGTAAASGARVVHQSADEMDEIARVFNAAADGIHALEQHSTRISAVVNVIDAVAGQTNLLALNAAIEAARAGEQGRGFAVVADEVRLLAERTSTSTHEIGNMVQAVQSGSSDAVRAMRQSLEQVGEGVTRAHAAGDSLRDITAATERAAGAVAGIRAALLEQSSAARDIARNVERLGALNDGTLNASEATARLARDVRRLSQQVDGVIAQFKL